ncbi:VIT family protein [Oceanicoccus sp. KOV_DT_Chl]|uniref:VIT1/CCC1 transporter family protein n=1 Tax=Oceanicoccus sp. KOV_DT_Chl TaxID=1904639 RepID=UPI000C7E3FA8|nr:VIT family protein [Oceanicoccus sp. KOV_DT_Chl]
MTHPEAHKSHRAGWLRAAVLGANDGIVSTASLIIGIATASATQEYILLAGIAGLVAGAMSMAAGEYVSVSSQADTENADLAIEKKALENDFESELDELTEIYQTRGLESGLAKQVAQQLMAHDALGAHAKDELGITDTTSAKPLQAAFYSAVTFTIGAALPLSLAWAIPGHLLVISVAVSSLFFLALLGGIAAKIGGASITAGALRVTVWGALAMSITAVVGNFFGVATQ